MSKFRKPAWLAMSCRIFSILCCVFPATQAIGKQWVKAEGDYPTVIQPGKCTLPDGSNAPDISTQIKLTRLPDGWVAAMESFGENSSGMWFINFTKNGVGEPSTQFQFNPPGGWSITGSQVNKSEWKRRFRVIAKATKSSNPVIVCEATIATKKNGMF